MLRSRVAAFLAAASLLLASCGGGGSNASSTPTTPTNPTPTDDYTIPAQAALSTDDVNLILRQAVGEAQAQGLPSVISVVDRVGNVLAVYKMNGAKDTATIPTPATAGGVDFDAQGVTFPAELGAIAKAITAAYLSSAGNAFTTRTASGIVQQNFPVAPNTVGLESGPLFGVQFSQLPCSDLNRRYGVDAMTGPKRSPLGLAADPGAIPLYKNGVVVGGVGVMGDGVYGADDNAIAPDADNREEVIALAASTGYQPPATITANRISIDGTSLPYIDAQASDLKSNPASPPALAGAGMLLAVRGYYDGTAVLAGTPYGAAGSGYRQASAADRSAGTVVSNPDAFILVDASGNNRFPIRGGTDGGDVARPLTAAEVKAIEEAAFSVMTRARGAIRQPQNSRMQATISIVDTHGAVLALARAPDAPVFGTDVSLQKARTVAFFSNPHAADDLNANASADVRGFVRKLRDFINDQNALTGATAYADRPIGLLARPYFPDGQVGTPNGPLSRPIANFNPFSTGLQSALIIGNIAAHIGYVTSGSADTPARCTTLPDVGDGGMNRLQNGIQIFPGAVPIYRGTMLVGAIGVSGDGIDQDDMVSFLGLYNGGVQIGTVGNAAADMRISSTVIPANKGGFLPYAQCPVAPFLDTTDQNACQGK